jgi:hypothetical protein
MIHTDNCWLFYFMFFFQTPQVYKPRTYFEQEPPQEGGGCQAGEANTPKFRLHKKMQAEYTGA